ncbi:MAG: urate oxidase [Planctomycetes bacterium]|nr:urate oxidase [Planctomycetota bacterium]
MAIVLGENRYGKAENRVFRITRQGDTHEILDLNVSVQLMGDFTETHLTGDNAKVLPTDTQKNTVFALSHKLGPLEPEAFGIALARHFIGTQQYVSGAEIRIEQYPWQRIVSKGKPHPRAFRRDGSHVRTATVRASREGASLRAWVTSGLEKLVVLKTGDSAFKGYLRDAFTTLKETDDRIMATEVTACWRWSTCDPSKLDGVDWATSHRTAMDTMLAVYADHYSLSLQQTLFAMGEAVLKQQDAIAAVRLSLPNKHHFVVDLSPFGQRNANEVHIAADRPYGFIEAVVQRDDAPPPPATWPNW